MSSSRIHHNLLFVILLVGLSNIIQNLSPFQFFSESVFYLPLNVNYLTVTTTALTMNTIRDWGDLNKV